MGLKLSVGKGIRTVNLTLARPRDTVTAEDRGLFRKKKQSIPFSSTHHHSILPTSSNM